MKLRKLFGRFKGFWLGIGVSALVVLFIRADDADPYFEASKNLEIYATIFKDLSEYYVDPIEPGRLVKTSIDAMLEDLDPYTNYITESDIEEYRFMTTGKYGGIGASMRRKGNDIYIGDVYENSPSQKAGLHPGDLIVAIDNHPVEGKTLDDISVLLQGAPGTQLTLKVKDAYKGSVSEKIITRGEIEISSVPYAGLVGVSNDVAYVKLTQFTQGCGRQVRNAFDSLKKVNPNLKGVILDLRNNPGGLLDEAVNVCNIFVDKGQLVVSTKGKSADMDKDYTTPGAVWDKSIPLAVIVNHSSASASEIVAGTMQDLDRGVIIGERSYGKGLVQVTRPLGYNAQLKLTIARYYTPSGRCIQAIDYAHRNADGSAGYMPDSLKKAFKTADGRKVLSGGGINPDVKIKDEPISEIAITLYTRNYFFDYATEYVHDHSSIAQPDKFGLTDLDFNNFAKWLDNKDYSYKTETEDVFDSLKRSAIKEHYYDGARSEFDALQASLAHNKKDDLFRHKEEVMHLLESEIVSRYYFLRGRIAQSLRYDRDFSDAMDVLNDPARYEAILHP